jgi:hypothetical protein
MSPSFSVSLRLVRGLLLLVSRRLTTLLWLEVAVVGVLHQGFQTVVVVELVGSELVQL